MGPLLLPELWQLVRDGDTQSVHWGWLTKVHSLASAGLIFCNLDSLIVLIDFMVFLRW